MKKFTFHFGPDFSQTVKGDEIIIQPEKLYVHLDGSVVYTVFSHRLYSWSVEEISATDKEKGGMMLLG